MSTQAHEPAADVHVLHGGEPPPPVDPTRGLKLARRLERTADLLRQARLRVDGCDARGRKKAVVGLDRLFAVLHDLERDVIATPMPKPFSHDVRALLDEADEHLTVVVSRKKRLKRRHLQRLRAEVRHLRRRFESLLGS